ncbi:MAG: DEAD/DEAH box helicase [Deltaproteobacteria bacterium]|nr:DEAD/DEAH box helicase [Deltaproteobacteria bacterium]
MSSTDHTNSSDITSFASLALPEPILHAVADAGYTMPTPIQTRTIPALLTGRDLIAQAQTGTGKTAAFALPLLSGIDISNRRPQVLVLAPTRELANQVADGFTSYSRHLKGLSVLPVYGGSDYDVQLRGLRRGAHIVVGTPGRVMDHMRRGTLLLDGLSTMVLDEADEMLRMGFIDDVEWILGHLPEKRQIALFSATMPKPIRAIANRHLNEPEEILIESRTSAAEAIRQRYVVVPGAQKADALIRILEMESHDGVMVFVKTKTATVEVTERLCAHGLSACALNGDLSQALRERTVSQLKRGKLNIIVATDVAARGLDVDRISHVFNFDVPNDAETYVHRIGRTGRAGRQGEAILFLTPSDKRILKAIETTTRQPIEGMTIPSIRAINERRIERFNEQITKTLETANTQFFEDLIHNYFISNDVDPLKVSAAIAHILQGDRPILLPETAAKKFGSAQFSEERADGRRRRPGRDDRDRQGRDNYRGRDDRHERKPRAEHDRRPERAEYDRPPARVEHRPAIKLDFEPSVLHMQAFKLEVGDVHGVTPSNIVGAIANESGLSSQHIGRIHVQDKFSFVELPANIPRKLWRSLKTVQVCNRPLNISKLAEEEPRFKNKKASKPKRTPKAVSGQRQRNSGKGPAKVNKSSRKARRAA